MDGKIDWLSFTLREYTPPRSASELYNQGKVALRKVSRNAEKSFFDGQGFDPSNPRAPYRISIARDDNGARIYGSSHTETTLFELSGRGCEPLRSHEATRDIISGIADTITRIDYAVDILDGLRPAEFANAREHNRFRSISYIKSRTGETVYVGSPKSDRFCRIYRYDPPHPRSELLRVEFVFRKKLARAAAEDYIATDDKADYIRKLGNTYGFDHAIWQPESSTDQKILSPPAHRSNQSAVSWLYQQVAPAMVRLMKEGDLDMADFLSHVYSQSDLVSEP